MAGGSDESPLDLKSVLAILESDASPDEQVLDAYNKLSHHISKELSLFERDLVEQGHRLVAVAKKHVTSDGELKNSITPKALNVMGYCVNTKDIVSLLSAAEMGELVSLWIKVIAETKEKFSCTYAFWCVASQRFPANIMNAELSSLLNAFSRAAMSWWGTSKMVEQAAMHCIQRLGEQCTKDMISQCAKWGPPYLRLLVSQSPQIREQAYNKVLKWSGMFAANKELVRTGMSTLTKQIVPVLNTMFTDGLELFTLKTCTLLMQIFKQELQNIGLLNSLLSILERAFRCHSPEVRCLAFQSWSKLIDILNAKGILQKAKFVELIMRVFKTRNANTEEVAVSKLNTWWQYVLLMGPSIWTQFEQIVKPLLQFCLGNTRLGVDSGSHMLRAVHDRCGDGAQVQVSSSVPGSPVLLPVFTQTQQRGLVILTYVLQDADHPAEASLQLEPLNIDNSMPLNVCIKNAKFLISAMVEMSKLFGATNEAHVEYVWERMTSFILRAVEEDRDESSSAVSSFLSQFQTLISSQGMPSKMTMKLFRLVCSLPADVLSSPSLVEGSLFKCRAHSLCELLLSSALTEFGEEESFVTLFISLVKCGSKHPSSTLPFLENVGKLLDSQAPAMDNAEVLWRLWSFVANQLQEYMSSTNQVDQDDDLWPNFGCLYTALLLPVNHLLGSKLSQMAHKTAMKTLTELYLTFARLAAMVTTAEANAVVEELSLRILSKASAESYEKDPQTLEDLTELCQTMVGTIDFSSLTTSNPFMKAMGTTPSAKPRTLPKPLGNLHSYVSLLAQLMTWMLGDVHSQGGKPATVKQTGEDSVQISRCCVKLVDILTALVTKVKVSSLISHMMEILTSPLASLFTAVPKKLSSKVCTSAAMQKLDRLWHELCRMLQTDFKGQYDSDLLHQMAPLLHATFLHSRRAIKNQTVELWNATFGAGSAPLTYPTNLQSVLVKMREKTQLSLPGWIAMDVAVIDETPLSQMSQMDSQAPEPLLPGMPSPVHLRGSFLNKDLSPKPAPKSTTPKRIVPASENRRSASNARKRLPLDSMPKKDFVVITQTPNKRRVLTEHQKEVLKEKRALPAMYNNLEASQDISLMAHFSSDATQQDSVLDKPTIDDVIVINSSQSQNGLEQEQMNTEQPSSDNVKSPMPRRSSRRSSVRFQEARSSKESQDLKLVVKTASERKLEDTSVSESLSQERRKDGKGSEVPSEARSEKKTEVVNEMESSLQEKKQDDPGSAMALTTMSDNGPKVIRVEDSTSQDMNDDSGHEHSSLSIPTPQPNVMADGAEKLVDTSSSKETSQSQVSQSSQSSVEKRQTRSAVKKNPATERSASAVSEKPSSRQSRSMSRTTLKRRIRSQETERSPEVVVVETRGENNLYTFFKNLLKRNSSEQMKEGQSSSSQKRSEGGDELSSKASLPSEKSQNESSILAEESRSPQDPVIETTSSNISSIGETPTKTGSSRAMSITGVKKMSTRSQQQMAREQPVLHLTMDHGDHEHSISSVSAKEAEDWPAHRSRFKLQPPVVCEEVASQGFPAEVENSHSVAGESQRQRKVKKKTSESEGQEEGNALLEKHGELGFSGLLKPNVDQDSERDMETETCSGEEGENVPASTEPKEQEKADPQAGPTLSQTPLKTVDLGKYDPLLTPTLRLTPLPRRFSHVNISETFDDSQKQLIDANNSENMSRCSQDKDLLTESPTTFDPTKESTLSGPSEHTRKRKQLSPKKIADPSRLRRTPRKIFQKKSFCDCCKTKPGSRNRHSSSPTKKVQKKPGRDLPPSQNNNSPCECRQSRRQTSQRSSDVQDSENNSIRNENLTDSIKKRGKSLSPQDLGEVTPEIKTSSTPHRHSTTERKKMAAKQKSALKSLGPALENVSDSESSQSALQSASKAKKWKKDVFNSKKEQEKNVDTETFCVEGTEVGPTSTCLKRSHSKSALNDSTSKSKTSSVAKGVRSPPKLRLRRKKIAPSDKVQNDGKVLDGQTKEKTETSCSDHDSSFERKVRSESGRELRLAVRSKTKQKSGEKDEKKTTQKKKGPLPLAHGFPHSTLSAQSLARRRRIRTRRSRQKAHLSPELQAMLKGTSEEAGKEAVIELYESNQSSSHKTSPSKPQGSIVQEAENESNPEKGQPEDHNTEDKSEEHVSLDVETKDKPCRSQPPNRPAEMQTVEGQNFLDKIAPERDILESEGVQPACSQRRGDGLAEMDVPDDHSTVDDDGSQTEMRTEPSDDCVHAEASSRPLTSVTLPSKIHITHCGGAEYIEGEGSEDIFNDKDQDTPPVPLPFSQRPDSDGNITMNENTDPNTMVSTQGEECLESDFPHNQRGLEMDQDSSTPSEVNDSVEMTEEQSSPGKTHEGACVDEDGAELVCEGTVIQGETSCTTIVDKTKESCSAEKSKKSLKRSLSKTELFSLIDQSDVTAEEIIEYLQDRENTKSCLTLSSKHTDGNLECGGGGVAQENSQGQIGQHSSKGTSVEGLQSQNMKDCMTDNRNSDAVNCGDVNCCTSEDSPHGGDNSRNRTALLVGSTTCADTSRNVSVCASGHSADASSGSASDVSVNQSLSKSSRISIPQKSKDRDSTDKERDQWVEHGSVEDDLLLLDAGSQENASAVSIGPANCSEPTFSSASASALPCSSAGIACSSSSEIVPDELSVTSNQLSVRDISSPHLRSVVHAMCGDHSEITTSSSHRASHVTNSHMQDVEITEDAAFSVEASSSCTSQPSGSSQRSSSCSPGILNMKKRKGDESLDLCTPPSKKLRRVSFANPVEVGATPTCEECAGVPSCDECRAAEPERIKGNFSEVYMRSKERVIAFLAEHSMPLAAAPKVLDLVTALSNDKAACDRMRLDDATASYKLKYGVAATFQDELLSELRETPFALNLDEAMNSNHKKVVTILVSHFSPTLKKTVVHHLVSFVVKRLTSEILYGKVVDIFEQFHLPWTNLMALLTDSCAVMRGKKSGLETRIREQKAPHLLDIDSDSCRHAHNAAKEFCAPFQKHVESMLHSLHADFRWSPHNGALLADLCLALNIKPSLPMEFVSHRWLSLLDIALDTVRMFNALALFYFSYLQGDDKHVYQQFVEDIFSQHDLQLETKMTINKLQDTIRKTFMTATKDGKERKSRLIEKLFYFQEKTLLHLHFYCSVLPILQEYIKFFQKKEPVIHELHNKQEALLKDFFMCFIKCEQLQGGPKILLRLDLSNENHHLPTSGCFYGQYVKTELAKRGKKDNLKAEFLQQAHQAYIHGGTALQKKMPLNDPVLRSFSCLDPLLRTSSTALLQILKLPTFFKHLLSDQEIDQFDFEARKFNTDNSLPAVTEKDSIDSWWAQISTDKYPVLTRLARASISCFHGPLVESSFSTMSEIIDKSNTSIDEHTYSAIQTVKYALKAEGKTAVQFFSKKQPMKEALHGELVRNMTSAWRKNQERLLENREQTKRKSESLGVSPQKQTTKRKATNDLLEEAKRARLEHQSSTKSTRSSQSSGNCGKTCSKPTPKSKHGDPHSDSERVTHHSSPVSKEGNAESKDTIGTQNKSATGNTKVGPPGHQTSGSSTPASRSKQTSLASFFQPAKVKQSEGKSAQNERDKQKQKRAKAAKRKKSQESTWTPKDPPKPKTTRAEDLENFGLPKELRRYGPRDSADSQSPNSYHSTQESQLDSVNPIFPKLTNCKDPLDSILPIITISLFVRGLQNMLYGRGIKTVGHLASLTEKEVEQMPFTAPKTKTLRNALKNHHSKLMGQQPTCDTTLPGIAWSGFPTTSFYKKSPKERKHEESHNRQVEKAVGKTTESKKDQNQRSEQPSRYRKEQIRRISFCN